MKQIRTNAHRLIFKKAFFTTLLLLLLQLTLFAQTNNQNLRLFIIGNSFSQNASTYLPIMAKEQGKSLTIGRAELGGCSLERHWKSVELATADPNDPAGKPYKGKSLQMLLSEGTWDIVTLQQFSYLSGDVESYSPDVEKLYHFIKKLQPNAQIVLHQTWAYREDAKKFGQIAAGVNAKSNEEMWVKSRAAYHAIAKQLKLKIIPVGDAFRKVTSNPLFHYQKDEDFDFKNPVYPALPKQQYSLNMGYYWKNGKEFIFDPNHANEAGKYLGALIWYGFLFNDTPAKIQFAPKQVAAPFAEKLKAVAAEVTLHSN